MQNPIIKLDFTKAAVGRLGEWDNFFNICMENNEITPDKIDLIERCIYLHYASDVEAVELANDFEYIIEQFEQTGLSFVNVQINYETE